MSDSLDRYRKKRDFSKTREPAPGRQGARTTSRAFVVHRHAARRLHYDLRIEVEGVLSSWAVPKGFSYDPREKRLAVRTEDHPIEYEDFSGAIPKGEYGAGSMTIWDRGHYELKLADTPREAIDKGEVKLILSGRRLRGEWHLVKTNQGKDTWLLFKSKDVYAGKGRDALLAIDLDEAPEKVFPRTLRVMEPGGTREPFRDPSWVFEMGFEGKRVQLAKRNETITWRGVRARLPRLEREALRLRAENALIDGVLVTLDEKQRPCPLELERALATGSENVFFYAFDLPYYQDYDLRSLPLLRRKELLRATLPQNTHLLYVDHVLGEGEKLVDAVRAAGLHHVIAKRADAPYVAGPDARWVDVPLDRDPTHCEKSVTEVLESRRKKPRGRSPYTNVGKVYWPAEGITKGELIAHYEAVAEFLLPHLHERPVHLNRFPEGIDGPSFYQRQPHEDFPTWIETEILSDSPGGEAHGHMICNHRDALLYLVNLGSIDLHPWLSRRGTPDSPDWSIIDLDPKDAPFQHVVRIAQTIGKLLHGIGLRPLLKTSGSTGLHIYVPLREGYTYEQSRTFAEIVARIIVREHRDIATVERHMGHRQGRVYVDYGQNRRGQTVVPPYVARPVPGATVSTPLLWDELGPSLDRSVFNLRTIRDRVASVGDLFRDALTDRQDLTGPLTELTRQLAN
ncbi:MAG: hypothetical protein H6834_14985 [Planctomycetes bacterium]|nr:hypothetical protein [Planctomycetota bacterium]